MKNYLFVLFIINVIPVSFLKDSSKHKTVNSHLKPTSIKLPACQACKLLVDSFNSELRQIVEEVSSDGKQEESVRDERVFEKVIMNLCKEDRAKDQCKTLSEKCRDYLQDWWMKEKINTPDIMQYLCIDRLNYCCPSGQYGPDCKPCPGYPDRVCSNNGKCKGNGTRKGNGQCSCEVGYTGPLCDECAPSYHVSYKDDNKLLCARCHSACDGNCSQAGARGCHMCRDGWRMDKTKGCVDINECFSKRLPCKRNEFCVNNEGSFSCLACDPSCDMCTGDGPDMCEKCAYGFVLKDNMCVNEKGYVSYSDVTRYLTYLGLCFATYIVFQNSAWAASAIGVCVAVYVTVSEYMLGTLTSVNLLSFSKAMDGLESLWSYD